MPESAATARPAADARPVGRLAPSPTGLLHLGHARSFLLAWWHARSRGGRVILRIEDLDRARCKAELVETCLRDLEWLGLDWDGEPILQSRDTSAMQGACEELLRSGKAYPCVCSRAEIAALSAPHSEHDEPRYPGTCRGRFATREEAQRATGKPAGVRLAIPPGPVAIRDGVLGEATYDVAAETGDLLIQRRDGAFAYQLAVVVDDARQGISEIVRGADLLPSAARQWHVQELLELPHPCWFHVPLVVAEDGERLAKRRGSMALAELRAAGFDPRAVVAWAARSSGQLDPTARNANLVRPEELLATFDIARVPRESVTVREDELPSSGGMP
jgi:glutamyl-tRNA synthetase